MVEIIQFILEKLFIYLLITIITCSLVEMVLIISNARSKILSEWISLIFDKPMMQPQGTTISLGQAIIDHSLITGLSMRGKIPSYIEAKNFTLALIEKITYTHDNPFKVERSLDSIISALIETNLLSTELKRVFLDFAYEAKEESQGRNEVKYFRSLIESWFNNSMGSLTGTLKLRYAKPLTLLFAAIVVVALNVDSIVIVQTLYSGSAQGINTVRTNFDTSFFKKIDQIKTSSADFSALVNIKSDIKKTIDKIDSAQVETAPVVPIGWNKVPAITPSYVFNKILGLYSTILIIILIAPMLFDLANKVSNVRGTGPKSIVLEVES